MRVEYIFDEVKIRELGYTKGRVYNTLYKEYKKRGFKCTRADDVLAFDSPKLKTDLSNIFIVRRILANTEWFLKTATEFLVYDNEFDTEPEDFLINIERLKNKPRAKEL